MSHSDFVRSLRVICNTSEETARIRFLFDLADKDKTGVLDFTEFALFSMISSRPDAEFELAFQVTGLLLLTFRYLM